MAKILVISPTPTHPPDAGNRARIFSLLTGLKSTGHQVHFAFVKRETGDEAAMSDAWNGFYPLTYQRPADRWLKRKYDKWAKRIGIDGVLPYRIDDWYTEEITTQLETIRQQVHPDIVMVEYVFFSKAFECFGPKILKVLDTHDIFGDRHKLYHQNSMTPLWFYTTIAQEKTALDRADVILAIQEDEAAYFRRLTKQKVITVGHMVHCSTKVALAAGGTERLLFIGSANPINVDGLRWFLEKVFPLVRRQLPDVELEVVGECADKVTAADGIILTGRVVNLAPHYQRATLVVNPIRFGTGLKIKAIEALAYGRPLVTTRVGAAGMEEWAGRAFLVADTPEEFAEGIRMICSSASIQSELVGNAIKLSRENNASAAQPLFEAIDKVTG